MISSAEDLRRTVEAARTERGPVGFVPTMGYFHDGHVSLMRRARLDRDVVAVSIFVNPLQFGPEEDLASYPRDLERDLSVADREGVDFVFSPSADEMYPGGAPHVTVDPGSLAERLEGASRPGHFRGVATVVAKLFHMVGRCTAYFGEKDAQQLAVIRATVRDLSFPVEVVGCPTVREPDGLAMSSRNVYLSPEDRGAALCLWRGLSAAGSALERGERDAAVLCAEIAGAVAAEPRAALDYAAIVDEDTFDEVSGDLVRPARALVAARVGPARLIDNVLLLPPVRDNSHERPTEVAR